MSASSLPFFAVLTAGTAVLFSAVREALRSFAPAPARAPPPVLTLPATTTVLTVSTAHECDAVLCEGGLGGALLGRPVVGLDMEWRSPAGKGDGRNKVAVVTLACPEVCVVVQVARCGGVPGSLARVLLDASVVKVGVAVLADARFLAGDYGLGDFSGSCADLRSIGVSLGGWEGWVRAGVEAGGRSGMGLETLCLALLGRRLPKDHRVVVSNWEAEQLSDEQIEYAALDSLAGVLVHEAMGAEHPALIGPATEAARGVKPPTANTASSQQNSSSSSPSRRPPLGRALFTAPASSAAAVPQAKLAKQSRKSPLYHNGTILSPEGVPLCRCNDKKIQWYLSRGLADLVTDHPPVIRLRFAPAGEGHGGDDYFLAEKVNACVVCGSGEHLVRFHVVPLKYRRHLPLAVKSRASRDVVQLCFPCQMKASALSDLLCEHWRRAAGAPDHPRPMPGHRIVGDPNVGKVKAFGKALSGPGAARIPSDKRAEMEALLCAHFGVDAVTPEVLQRARTAERKVVEVGEEEGEKERGPFWVDLGYFLDQVRALLGPGASELAIEEAFQQVWRLHFLAAMKPQHIHPKWCPETGPAAMAVAIRLGIVEVGEVEPPGFESPRRKAPRPPVDD
jgi:hypothetical protein